MRIGRILGGLAAAGAVATVVVVGAACSDSVAATQSLSESAVGAGSLAGTWQFNKDASDCPDGPAGPGRLGNPGGPGHAGGQGEPGGRGGPKGPGGPGGPAGLEACFAPDAVQLTIAVNDADVTFSHGDAFSHTIPTDGSTLTHSGPGGDVSVSAAWVDGALVVTQTTPRGTHTATYRVSEDGSQLTVSRVIDPPREDIEPKNVTQVWDRVAE